MTDASGLETRTHVTLALSAARRVMRAAEDAAAAAGARLCIAIVDNAGNLQLFARMDGTHTATIEVALAKARCAAAFARPTKLFAEALAKDGPALLALRSVVPFEGGVPLVLGDQVVGAIGASGGPPHVDGAIAQAGADVLLNEGA